MHAMLVFLATIVTAAVAAAGPPAWPQFRGPEGSGVAPDYEKPPSQIGPDKNVKWKVAVPSGLSSPIIAGDRLFLTGYLCGLNHKIIVVKVGNAMEKVCSGELDDRIAASPAIAGNTIYVRTGKSLYAFAEAR